MKTIEIRNRFTNEIIYTHTCENNTVKITVEKAVKDGASLSGASLVRANLEGANLRCANLEDANLYGANLVCANLEGARIVGANLVGANLVCAYLYGANLVCASLVGANLDGANLYGANLYGANLVGASLVGANLVGAKIPIYCKWSVSQIDLETIKIGCKQKTISEWDDFFASDEEFSTERGTKDFIQIQAHYEAMKAYINFLKANQL